MNSRNSEASHACVPEENKSAKISRTSLPRSNGGQPHVVVIGAGMAGLMSAHTVLRRAPDSRVTIVEPRPDHILQAALPLCAVGQLSETKITRPTQSLVPRNAVLLRNSVVEVDPVRKSVRLAGGEKLSYDILIPASGIHPDYTQIDGLADAMREDNSLSSVYEPKTLGRIRAMLDRPVSGNYVFVRPNAMFKCAGAIFKIANLIDSVLRAKKARHDVHIKIYLGNSVLFPVPDYQARLEGILKSNGIEVFCNRDLIRVNHARRAFVFANRDTGGTEEIEYAMGHMVPPMKPSPWLAGNPLAAKEGFRGFVPANQYGQHPHYPSVWPNGDTIAEPPIFKTGAAVHFRTRPLIDNVLRYLQDKELREEYRGTTGCMVPSGIGKAMLVLFDRTNKPRYPWLRWAGLWSANKPTWWMFKYGLPVFYWRAIVKGIV